MKTTALAPGRSLRRLAGQTASLAGLWSSGYFLKPVGSGFAESCGCHIKAPRRATLGCGDDRSY